MRYQAAPRPDLRASLRQDSIRRGGEHVFGAMAAKDGLKRCGRSGELKPLSDFAWRWNHRRQRHNMCRPCHSAYHREHYLANKQRYIEQARVQKEALRLARTTLLIEFLRSHPCVDCGEADPVVLSSTTSVTGHSQSARNFARRAGRASATRWRSARWSVPTAIAAERLAGGAPYAQS
jgi:hypothetical protein